MKLRMEGEEEEISGCSSGCQSGWTMYLDESYEFHPSSLPYRVGSAQQEEEEEEDQSMVSDASSGPPHFHEDDHGRCFDSVTPPAAALGKNGGKKRVVDAEKQQRQPNRSSSFLDDTASSPLFSFSKTSFGDTRNNMDDVLEFSFGFSATHFKGKSAFGNHLGYMQSSAPVKPTSTKPVFKDGGEKKTW